MITYRRAVPEDLDLLVEMRMEMLRDVIRGGEEEQWALSRERTEAYYAEAVPAGEHVAFFALDGEKIVGTGGICFYRVLPTYFKPTGEKAYVINMFTLPEYRRRGIGRKILSLLVEEALGRGVRYISLEATDQGRRLYENCGFALLKAEMQYVNETYES